MCLQFYGYLSQQQNMMQDYVRTGTYQRAILQNHTDFKDKVTLYMLNEKYGTIGRCRHFCIWCRTLLDLMLVMQTVFSCCKLKSCSPLKAVCHEAAFPMWHEWSTVADSVWCASKHQDLRKATILSHLHPRVTCLPWLLRLPLWCVQCVLCVSSCIAEKEAHG